MLQRPPMAALVRYNREINAGVERQQRAASVSHLSTDCRLQCAGQYGPLRDIETARQMAAAGDFHRFWGALVALLAIPRRWAHRLICLAAALGLWTSGRVAEATWGGARRPWPESRRGNLRPPHRLSLIHI